MRTPSLALAVCLAAAPAFAGSESTLASLGSSFHALMRTPVLRLVPGFSGLKTDADAQEDALIDLLNDADAGVRAQAARALKTYAHNWRTQNALAAVLERPGEDASVKRAAIKSLAWAAQSYNIRRKLIDVAQGVHEDAAVRAIAYKSLYAVSSEFDARNALQSALNAPSELLTLREAAAWGLWSDSSRDYGTKRALLSIAQHRGHPASLRLEALKSLFGTVQNDYEAKSLILAVAQNQREETALRVGATLSLIALNHDYQTQSLLNDLARRDPAPEVRAAAVKAMQNGIDLELVRYFHLSHYLGRFIDPLENE